MFSRFSEEAQKVLIMAKKEMVELKHPYVSSEHLLLSILHYGDSSLLGFLNKFGINYLSFKDKLISIIGIGKEVSPWFLYTPMLKKIIENAILDCKDENRDVLVVDLFYSLLEEGEGVANRVLLSMDVDVDTLYEEIQNKLISHRSSSKKLSIEEFAVDLTEEAARGLFDPVLGRDLEISQIIEILLRRKKSNPLLVGEAGVGKTALVEELARRISLGLVPEFLKNFRILSVPISSLIAGTKYRGEFEERIGKMISELESVSNVILFFDEIHTIIGAGGAEGAIDASNILKPYLARGKLKVIGATTNQEYLKYLEGDKAFDRRFQKVYVHELNNDDVLNILNRLKEIYEDFHSVVIPDEILNNIVDLSNRYISHGKQPDKAIDLLDSSCSKLVSLKDDFDEKLCSLKTELNHLIEKKNEAIVSQNYSLASSYCKKEKEYDSNINQLEINRTNKKKILTIDILYDVIFDKTKIPIKEIMKLDSVNIKNELNQYVIGQEKVISSVVDAFFSSYHNKMLMRCFLFVGKSGVGKTFLAQKIANMFYPADAFFKLDMNEYNDFHTASKIIGTLPGYVGYQDKNTLLDKIKLHPYCLLLLDNIEKAHPRIIKLFLQALEDGYLMNSSGERVSFKNSIIFMTLKIDNQEAIGFLNKENSNLELKKYFGSEFFNKIDEIFYFNSLSSSVIENIIYQKMALKYKDFSKSKYKKKMLEIKKQSDYLVMGARKIDKLLDKITVYQ